MYKTRFKESGQSGGKLLWSMLALSLIYFLLAPKRVSAYAHEECPICHGNRLGIGLAILTKERKLSTINPSTGRPLQRIEAICLSCHSPQAGYEPLADDALQDDEDYDEDKHAVPVVDDSGLEGTNAILEDMMLKPVDVGFRLIDLHQSHPVGIVPRTVKLPPEAKGFKGQENQLTCMGCHNHHPSNPNYKYLRWPAGKGEDLNRFCAHCHPDKAKPKGQKRRTKTRDRGMID